MRSSGFQSDAHANQRINGELLGSLRRVEVSIAMLIVLGLTISGANVRANEPLSFNRDIRPIFSDRCLTCHGPDNQSRQADLRLDRSESAVAHGAIVPGDSSASEMIARITSEDTDLQMPPPDSKKPRLTAKQVELLRRWIDEGGKFEPHWAYIPPRRETPPQVNQPDWVHNPIDRFVLNNLEEHDIKPSTPADKSTLVRRLYFDVTGLPPAWNDVSDFESDSRPDAYDRLVDKLLASPEFGERMATWWFDLVRFASTVGYHGDQDHCITPYRDWVIKSFNDNLPFDKFTIEQLAGDLLPNPTMWQQVATGYNRLLQTTHEGGAQDGEYRAKYLADHVRNYSETWLAASMGCAECHDHKFDPYTQEDFYSLEAFFADVDQYGTYDTMGRNTAPTDRPPEILAWTLPIYEKMQEVDSEISTLEKSLVGRFDPEWEKRRARLIECKTKRIELESQFVRTMVTQAFAPREIRILPRGNWMDHSGKVVQPNTPHFLPTKSVDGRRANRLDLANWTVSRDNPLTARVVVNRLWKLFYGIGLSKTLIDMGSQSEPPANQKLLDWLAVEFMESGWDVKHLVRLMVTAQAYRQSSRPRIDVDVIDPDNRLVFRQSRFRLEAEQVRDNALTVSGLLVRKLGGETVRPYQPAGYYSALNFPEREYVASPGDEQYRRSVYSHWQRQYLHPWLLAFDAPTREECTAQRPISTTPTAALVLLNDPIFVEAARSLAALIITKQSTTDVERINFAWKQVLSRDPTPAERDVIIALLATQRARFAADVTAAKEAVSIGSSPVRTDLDVSELATWSAVSRVLLNLEETIWRN